MKAALWVVAHLAGIMMLLLAACTIPTAEPPQPVPTTSAATPIEVKRTGTPQIDSPEITLPTPPTNDQAQIKPAQYYLDVNLDYAAKTIEVAQTISYTNNTGQTIVELPLIIPPAHLKEVFSLESIHVDQAYLDTQVEIDLARIDLLLDPPLDPGQHLEINLHYVLVLHQDWGSLGYTDRQLLLADWYPMIPPYREGTGWLINPPGQVGEYLVYPLSHFHLNLCLASTAEELIVAASAPLAGTHGDCSQYESQYRRNITVGISPYYQVSTAASDQVTVIAYTFPEHARLGVRAAELAVESWATFTDLFGDNQRDFLSIVEADIFDGLETDGLIFLSEWYYQTADPSPQNYFELLIVHETVHQWFYALIHNDQAHEPWLDEALATYSELLFYEIHHPELVDWWWDFRVRTYEPEGPVNAVIYDYSQYRPYINAVYLRGVEFLQALRSKVGEPAFFESLKRYTQSDPKAIHTSDDFFEAFTPYSDADLSEIITEFFQ